MKSLIIQSLRWLEKIHDKIFGMSVTTGVRSTVKNFFILLAGHGGFFILTVPATILLARIIGPSSYGTFTLIMSLSSILLTLMLFEVPTACMRYLSASSDDKKGMISTGLFLIILNFFLFVVAIFFFQNFLAGVLELSKKILFLIVVFAMLRGLYQFWRGVFQGLERFLLFSKLLLIQGTIFLAAAFFWYEFSSSRGFEALLMPAIFGFFGLSVCAVWILRELFYEGIRKKWISLFLSYGFYSFVGTLALTATANIDRFFLHRFFDTEAVGIYSAYLFSATVFFTNIGIVFFNALFQKMSQSLDHRAAQQKILHYAKKFAPLLFAITFALTAIVIRLYGASYPFQWLLVFFFSLFSFLQMLVGFLWTPINAEGMRGVRWYSLHTIIAFVIVLFGHLSLTKWYGVPGAILSNIAGYGYFLIAAVWYMKKKHDERKPPSIPPVSKVFDNSFPEP